MEQILSNLLFSYGFVPMLMALEVFESEEDFETCAQIVRAVQHHGKRFGVELPTRNGEEAAKVLRHALHKMGMTGKIIEKNIPYYVDEIVRLIKEQNKQDLSKFNRSLDKALNFNPKEK